MVMKIIFLDSKKRIQKPTTTLKYKLLHQSSFRLVLFAFCFWPFLAMNFWCLWHVLALAVRKFGLFVEFLTKILFDFVSNKNYEDKVFAAMLKTFLNQEKFELCCQIRENFDILWNASKIISNLKTFQYVVLNLEFHFNN